MSDRVSDERTGHVTTEEARELFHRYHRAVTSQERGAHFMSIPVDFKRDADVRLSAFIDQAEADRAELLAARRVVEWLRSEVSRARVERETGRRVAGFSGPLLPPGLVTKANKALDAYEEATSGE